MTITVSTDGSALGNPNGPMGWAWADHVANAARTDGHQHDGDSDAGGATNGTNQIGELCAVLEALRAHRGAEPLTIETDSQYAINCSTTWVKGWKKNGWKNSQHKPVKNAPLIKAIDAEIAARPGPVKFVWVKGHNGNPGNEKVDDLAHTYSGDARSGVKDGYLPLEGWQSLLASAYAKGVDIPADARMLIDGKITEEQYHLGRGTQSGGGLDDGNEDGSEDSDSQNAENENTTGQTDVSASHKPTLAERLAQPEGVPEYDFSGRKPVVAHHRAAENDETADENVRHDEDEEKPDTIGRTVRSHPNFSGSPVGDDVTIPADRSETPTETELPVSDETDESGEPAEAGNSAAAGEAERSAETNTSPVSENTDANGTGGDDKANNNDDADNHDITNNHDDTDDRLNGTSDDADNGHKSDDTDTDDESHIDATAIENDDDDTDTDDDTNADAGVSAGANADNDTVDIVTNDDAAAVENDESSDTPRATGSSPKPETNPEPRYIHNGLSVNGTLRFSPAPQTSPTYNGRPRHIRGIIAIDGYVAGDGTIVLNNVPFLIANEKHKK